MFVFIYTICGRIHAVHSSCSTVVVVKRIKSNKNIDILYQFPYIVCTSIIDILGAFNWTRFTYLSLLLLYYYHTILALKEKFSVQHLLRFCTVHTGFTKKLNDICCQGKVCSHLLYFLYTGCHFLLCVIMCSSYE